MMDGEVPWKLAKEDAVNDWNATQRYDMESAPGGLGFVHDLLNTKSAGKPRRSDLLLDLGLAQAWMDAGLEQWALATGRRYVDVKLTERDLEHLRYFRDELASTLSADGDPDAVVRSDVDALPTVWTTATSLKLKSNGTVQAEPQGAGAGHIESLAMTEIFRAQLAGTWHRLKLCRSEKCRVAFFDRSRNNSGVWHDVKICGNPANLRAYRARQHESKLVN